MKALNTDIQLINIEIQCVYRYFIEGNINDIEHDLMYLVAERFMEENMLRIK